MQPWTMLATTAFALLLTAPALQLAPDAPGLCGREMNSYEAEMPRFPGVCTVYCVPQGECEGKVQSGQMSSLGITAQGNCKSRGYTETAELGNLTKMTAMFLDSLTGPCEGMKLMKFQKPATAEQKAAKEDICGTEMTSYESRILHMTGVCSVLCLPRGECEGLVQEGQLPSLGVTAQGSCRRKGWYETADFAVAAASTAKHLEGLQGPCSGTMLRMVQEEAVCMPGETAFEAFSPLSPGVCSVFCVDHRTQPCLDTAPTASLSSLNLTAQGNCRSKGFTEPLELDTSAQLLKQQWPPCKGIFLKQFQKPQEAEQKDGR